jgi:hypothetical protein
MKATYRFFLWTLCAALMLEAAGSDADPWSQLSLRFHNDISSWTPFHIIVTVLELCVGAVALMWVSTRRPPTVSERRQRVTGTLLVPIAAFGALLVVGILNGYVQGGSDTTTALWEVRGFAMLIAIYALTSVLVRSDDAVNDLVAVTFIAATVLAVENIYRWYFILHRIVADDLAYDHVDSVVLVFAVMVCLGVLTFGGRRWQRRYALVLLPLLILCMEVMKRRAAFAILAVGLVAFLIFFVRLRPRLFWKVVPPLAVLTAIYLAAYWNGNGTLAQPARAISSQFSPDPRDAASNFYRLLEKSDIVLNIQQAPLTGLGFGRPYRFYFPLPDLSGWPFWHYISHNAILWVWMKDGALGFIVFWWLLGRAAYDGSRAVETQREEWNIASALHAMLAGGGPRGAKATAFERRLAQYAEALLKPAAKLSRSRRRSRRTTGTDAMGLNVPTWDRTDKFRSVTAGRSGALGFIVACVCLVPIQVTYSYVDLGLISERDMLLLGLALGVIAHAKPLLGVQESRQKRRKSQARPVAARRRSRELVLTPAESVERAQELVLRGRARTGARSRPLNPSRPLFPTQPTAQGVTALARLESPARPRRNTRTPASPSASVAPPQVASAEEDTTPRMRTITPPLIESPLPWEQT